MVIDGCRVFINMVKVNDGGLQDSSTKMPLNPRDSNDIQKKNM